MFDKLQSALVTDFMGPAGDISSQQHLIMEGQVRRGTTEIDPQCICQVVKAYGDFKQLPTL